MPRVWLTRAVVLVLIAATVFTGRPARQAAATPGPGCVDGTQSSGAVYRICMPVDWNGRLVLWAHGFVAPQLPVAIPEDQLQLPDGTSLPDVITSLGFAFATSSYRKNGLAILEGIDDTRDLVQIFTAAHRKPDRVYLTGASEGGLVTALSIERYPQVYSGGLAGCGPIGDFPKQVNYFGDVRVLFDFFFPNMIPGSPVNIPADVIADWDGIYAPRIRNELLQNQDKMWDLMRTASIPLQIGGFSDPGDFADVIVKLLWYNVVATNDAITTLGGQPFNNRFRWYSGSDDDWTLNTKVRRIGADASAVLAMQSYQTSGRLQVPLVTLHTTLDPIVPYWQEDLYTPKASPASRRTNVPIFRDGHCNFTEPDALWAFFLLVLQTL